MRTSFALALTLLGALLAGAAAPPASGILFPRFPPCPAAAAPRLNVEGNIVGLGVACHGTDIVSLQAMSGSGSIWAVHTSTMHKRELFRCVSHTPCRDWLRYRTKIVASRGTWRQERRSRWVKRC